ncbi:MAG: hypothetical protein COA42_22695 [Alteromonadaceae bacterium]|nr:MAG: hypothetical protein COA42_22695 [Alteromonadaceae bacterium]
MSENAKILGNGLKLVSEVVISPGTSLLLDGNIASGVLHMAGGLLSRVVLGATLGPIAVVGLVLNSYSKSTTGVGILGQFSKPAAAPAVESASE